MTRSEKRRHAGEKSRTPGGYATEILGLIPSSGYDVLIHDGHGTVKRGVPYSAFRDGRVCSPYDRTARGIGCMGSGPYTRANARGAHGAWANMLTACQGQDAARSVCGEWLDFQVFAAWYEAHYYNRSLDLHLNLSLSGGTIYGPDTCVLIPRELTGSVPKQQSKPRRARRIASGRGMEALPQGVVGAAGGRYAARVCAGGRTTEIGPYDTPEEARKAYLAAKADALEAHAARIDPVLSDEVRAAVARCCARLRDEAGL